MAQPMGHMKSGLVEASLQNSQQSPTGAVSAGIAASEYVLVIFVSTASTFRWLQFYMATSLIVIDLGLVAIVANLETQRDLNNLEGLI